MSPRCPPFPVIPWSKIDHPVSIKKRGERKWANPVAHATDKLAGVNSAICQVIDSFCALAAFATLRTRRRARWLVLFNPR